MQYDAAKVAAKTEVSECSERLRSGRQAVWRGIPGTTGAAGLRQKCKTVRPAVAVYLDELST